MLCNSLPNFMKKNSQFEKCMRTRANIFLQFAIFVNLRAQGFLHYYEIVKYSCMIMGFLKFRIILEIQSYFDSVWKIKLHNRKCILFRDFISDRLRAKAKMSENCRLHNQLFIGNDFCRHRAATIYCGTSHRW